MNVLHNDLMCFAPLGMQVFFRMWEGHRPSTKRQIRGPQDEHLCQAKNPIADSHLTQRQFYCIEVEQTV